MKFINLTVRRVRGKLSIRLKIGKISLGLDVPSIKQTSVG